MFACSMHTYSSEDSSQLKIVFCLCAMYKAFILTTLNVRSLTHFSLRILPSIQHLTSPPIFILCDSSVFSFSLCIHTKILKFSLQISRPLFTPPEAKQKEKWGERKNVPSGDFSSNSKSAGGEGAWGLGCTNS